MVQVYRAEVAIDRAVVNYPNSEEKAAGRLWAILGVCESGLKVVAAVVALVVQEALKIISNHWGRDAEVYRDVTRTQFASLWRCLVGLYSPRQALQPLLEKAAQEGGHEEGFVAVQNVKRSLPWGTEYDPSATSLLEKLRFCGPIQRSAKEPVKQS